MALVSELIESDLNAPQLDKPEVAGEGSSFQEEQEKLLNDYNIAKVAFNRVVTSWSEEVEQTKRRRLLRDVEIDVKELHAQGKLDKDETIIPVRVIDGNIQREQPPYINYLKNSRRLAIFTCLSNPEVITSKLELDFTQGMSYTGWEIPHYKCLDGTQTHGWDAVEVVFDSSKPLKVGIEHIGHDMLLFPLQGNNIQDSSEVLRAYDVTVLKLKSYVDDFGFDDIQVGKITSKVKDTDKQFDNIRIYKRFKKFNNQVYVSWFCLEHGTDDWLKAPAPLYLGIKHKEMQSVPTGQVDLAGQPITTQQEIWVDTPITLYPVFILPYRETEKPKIKDHKGRCFYDENKQEAQTAVQSSFVNGIVRASQVYGSEEMEDGTGSSLDDKSTIRIIPNRIFKKPIRFWHTDYPDPMVLKALQYFDVSNSQEMNQPNFAALNREDSRKTAKEIGAAQQEKMKLDSVQLTLLSTHIRSVYSFAWLIVQSQALQGKIKFLLIKIQQPSIDPLTQQPAIDTNTQQPIMTDVWVNDEKTIAEEFDVRAAGDVDVVQKDEKIQQMQADWPVISTTVLSTKFLADMLRLKYPDTGDQYAKILEEQGSQFESMKTMVKSMSGILAAMIKDHPEVMQEIPPDQQAVVQQMIQQAQGGQNEQS